MNLLNYIPFGKENAVTREDLVKLTKMKDRNVREEIAKLREITTILSIEKGYFRPTLEEKRLIEKWIRREESRLKSIALSLEAARNRLRESNEKIQARR